MSLMDWFFPMQAQARQLRNLVAQKRARTRANYRQGTRVSDLQERIEELEGDLGYAVLVLGALLEFLETKGVMGRAELKKYLDEVDELDGVPDGRLDINVLRGRLG